MGFYTKQEASTVVPARIRATGFSPGLPPHRAVPTKGNQLNRFLYTDAAAHAHCILALAQNFGLVQAVSGIPETGDEEQTPRYCCWTIRSYISAKTQTLQSRYHMTMGFCRKMSPTIATKKLSRSEGRKNQRPTTQPRPRKNLHAQPVGKPKVCTTPCLTPTSTDGQTLLEVMPITIVQARLPLPMPPTTQDQAARRNKSCVHPTYTQKPKISVSQIIYNQRQTTKPLFQLLFSKKIWGSCFVCLPEISQDICEHRMKYR